MSYFISPRLFVIFSSLITSVGKERAVFSAINYSYFVVSVRRCSSSDWCLGKAALFHCGTPWALHIIILKV